MKISLIMAPNWSRVKPPISLALLAANLKKYNHKVSVFDLNNQLFLKCKEEYRVNWEIEEDIHWIDKNFINEFLSVNKDLIDDYVEDILEQGSKVIGFSVYFPNQLMSLEIAKLIKERDRDRIIVFGGPQCMRQVAGRDIIKQSCVDAIVVNEGDQTVAEMARVIEENGNLEFCPGTLFKKDGDLLDCGDREPISDLDSLPFTDFSGFNLQEYERPQELPILSSRGCIWSCLFCTAKFPWQRYRLQSAERTFAEIKYQLEKYPQVQQFTFHDCLINGDATILNKLCQIIIDEKKSNNIKNFVWWAQGIIRSEMSRELLQKMKLAGCNWMTYGIESGSEKITSLMGKRYSPDISSEVIKNTHEAGIYLTAIFMFGFPGEKPKDFECTLKFLEKNHDYFDGVIPADGLCVIERHSLLYKNAERYGLYLNPHPFFWQTRDGDNNYLERFRRFEVFCKKAEELKINLTGSFDKNRRHKTQIIKEYEDYCNSINLNICGGLVQKEKVDKINFIWELHKKCMFDCIYCKDKHKSVNPVYLSPEKWDYIWKNIYDDYGSVRITIKGGEPYIYPAFFELSKRLASLHTLEIHTNLPQKFLVEKLDLNPKRVTFCLNFHPRYINQEYFLEKALLLKKLGYSVEIYCLAHPVQIEKITQINMGFEEKGFKLNINVFWGEYDNRNYPAQYTQRELEILKPFLGDLNRICYNLKGENPKGKLCNAGYRWCVIGEDGSVSRCKFSPEDKLGDIMDNSLKLFNEPLPCNKEFCPYNEFDNVY